LDQQPGALTNRESNPSRRGTPATSKAQRHIACLLFFIPAFVLLGAFAALDNGADTGFSVS
jgi:hypothetical protein